MTGTHLTAGGEASISTRSHSRRRGLLLAALLAGAWLLPVLTHLVRIDAVLLIVIVLGAASL
ncbi:MAG: hypothetical protein H0T78_11840, partial [Longispora sp.]|nr:hypothetical protein [Longispora sp. (in: high G+C Gram-positive bacteria)]